MVIKIVTNADVGTADIVGGDDWDQVATAINTKVPSYINQPFKYLIHRTSDNPSTPLICKNQQTGITEFSGLTGACEDVFQYALTNSLRASIYVAPGSYTMSAGFAGLTVSQVETTLVMDPGALLNVPQGYSGSLIIIGNGNSKSVIRGGRLTENGTPQKLWNAFLLNSTTAGIGTLSISDTYIRFADTGIKLHTQDTTGPFINACTFNNIFIDTTRNGIVFDHTGSYTDQLSGCNTNMFSNITYQADASTVYGIKDVNGRRNMFLNDYIVDFSGAQITCNITANARNTQIIGGTVTSLNFADLTPAGSETLIRDEYQGDTAQKRKTYNYEDAVVVSTPADPSTGTVRKYAKTVDANNDGYFMKRKVNGAIVEVLI